MNNIVWINTVFTDKEISPPKLWTWIFLIAFVGILLGFAFWYNDGKSRNKKKNDKCEKNHGKKGGLQ